MGLVPKPQSEGGSCPARRETSQAPRASRMAGGEEQCKQSLVFIHTRICAKECVHSALCALQELRCLITEKEQKGEKEEEREKDKHRAEKKNKKDKGTTSGS